MIGRELGSEDAQRPDGQVVQPFKSSKFKATNSKPRYRTEQPVVGTDTTEQPGVGTDPRIASSGRKTSRSQEIENVLFLKKLLNMIERSDPLLNQEHPKHVHLMTARASTLKIKRHMIERGNPL